MKIYFHEGYEEDTFRKEFDYREPSDGESRQRVFL